MSLRYWSLSLFLGAFAAAAVSCQVPRGPAKAEELIRLVGSGDKRAIRSFVQGSFTQKALAGDSVENWADYLCLLWDKTRGLDVYSFNKGKAGEWVATCQAKLTGQWFALTFTFEGTAEDRIDSFDYNYAYPPKSRQKPGPTSERELVGQVDGFMRKLAGADVFSGTVLLAKGDRVLYKKAFGFGNKDFEAPNRVDTKLNLASLNKMFTAVAIAQLVEAGKISFDDPLSKFVPGYPTKEAAEAIRVKHLLTHTSGLGSYLTPELYASAPGKFRTIDDFLSLAKNDPPRFAPGTKYRYSNTGFLLLGKIIEVVSGQSYYDYMQEYVFKPAGMIKTGFYDLDLVNPNLALGYQREYTDSGVRFRSNVYHNVSRGGPAGGGYSTVEDLFHFSQAFLGGKLVGPKMVATMTTPKPELGSPNYGYGFGVLDSPKIIAHQGGDDGISTSLEVFPEQGYTFILLSNYGQGSTPAVLKMRELIGSMPNRRG